MKGVILVVSSGRSPLRTVDFVGDLRLVEDGHRMFLFTGIVGKTRMFASLGARHHAKVSKSWRFYQPIALSGSMVDT